MKKMKAVRRIRILLPVVAVLLALIVTSGVALAGWDWCDDPILSIGNDRIGYTTTNVLIYPPSGGAYKYKVEVEVPEGVNTKVLDAQGAKVKTDDSDDLSVKDGFIQTEISVRVTGPMTKEKVGVRVAVNAVIENGVLVSGDIIGEAQGRVGKEIKLKVNVPVANK